MKQLAIRQQITSRTDLALDKYLIDISKLELISVEEEASLAQRIKTGDNRALNKMIQANLRFVVSVAKQYQNLGLSLIDLINEGNVGLINAAQKFDETRGFRFISYAVWWIRRFILQALADQVNTIRLPANRLEQLMRLQKMFVILEQQYEREPTLAELSQEMKEAPHEIEALMMVERKQLSIDAPLNSEETTNLADILFDNLTAGPDSNLEYESLQNEVERVLRTLSSRESIVLKLFFGLNGYSQHTTEEIANRLDLSVSYVRQVKDKALTQLKNTKKTKLLRGYLA